MDANWITWIMQTVLTLMIGALVYFMKRTITKVEERIDKQEQRMDQLERDTQTVINNMPLTYTLREDFLRSIANFDKKQDKVLDKISDLTAAVSALRGDKS